MMQRALFAVIVLAAALYAVPVHTPPEVAAWTCPGPCGDKCQCADPKRCSLPSNCVTVPRPPLPPPDVPKPVKPAEPAKPVAKVLTVFSAKTCVHCPVAVDAAKTLAPKFGLTLQVVEVNLFDPTDAGVKCLKRFYLDGVPASFVLDAPWTAAGGQNVFHSGHGVPSEAALKAALEK